jgi:hypothetical protein
MNLWLLHGHHRMFSTKYPEWSVLIIKIKTIATVGLGIGLLVDGLIAVLVSYFLLQGRKSCIVSTRNIINTLVKYSINTGGVLMIGAVLEVIGFSVWSRSLAFMGLFQIQTQRTLFHTNNCHSSEC